MSLSGAGGTSVFVQFHNDGVTQVTVNGHPAVIVQNALSDQPVHGSVDISSDELLTLQYLLADSSPTELRNLLELTCKSVPGAKEFLRKTALSFAESRAESQSQNRHQTPNNSPSVSAQSRAAIRNPTPRTTVATTGPTPPPATNVLKMMEAANKSLGIPQIRPASLRPATYGLVDAAEVMALDAAAGPPKYDLCVANSVEDIWKEWTEGMGGWPALSKMEEKWGPLLRPSNRQRAAWCRRKVVVDEIRARVRKRRAAGLSEGEGEQESEKVVIEQLEVQRGERSLFALIKEVQNRRKGLKRSAAEMEEEGDSPE